MSTKHINHIEVGDTVLYFFRRVGDPPIPPLGGRDPAEHFTCRPAIITSIVDNKSSPRRVNLRVFFEFSDVQRRTENVYSSMGTRQEEILHQTGPGRDHRSDVFELVGLTPMRIALDGNVWRARGGGGT